MTRNDELRQLMQQHQLARKQVCMMLGIQVAHGRHSSGTVDDWLANRTEIPAAKLELLQLKVKARR